MRVTEEAFQALGERAKEEGRTRSDMMRVLLQRGWDAPR